MECTVQEQVMLKGFILEKVKRVLLDYNEVTESELEGIVKGGVKSHKKLKEKQVEYLTRACILELNKKVEVIDDCVT